MKPFRLFLILIPLALTACGLTPQQQADYSRVENSGVSPAIYDKMLHGDDLSVSDVEALGRAHVSSAVILRYIRDQDTVYYLRSSDVIALEKAGVDPSVADFMLQTGSNYGPYGGYGGYPYGYGYGGYGYGYGFDPFWYPGFYGSFGYGFGRGYGYHGHHGGYGGYGYRGAYGNHH